MSERTPLFELLGTWAADARLSDVPEAARGVALDAILDCVGVTVAGADTPVGRIVENYVATDRDPRATLVGRERLASVETAAFVNGAQGHALDYDDCNGSLGGHPSVVVLPAALAVAEDVGATGAALLEAYCIGFEVAAKVGRCLNFAHYERGWHPTATLGVFGATAAAGKLLGLDGERIATALAVAASTAAGMKANFGTATKPLQAGRAAQNGIFAARMSAMGADANVGAFEHEQGFAELFNGSGNYDVSRAFATLADPWDLIDPGLVVKRYPCCASTHGAIDSAVALRDQLRSQGGLQVADIAKVEIFTHPRRLRHTDRPVVHTGFQGKFSVQYTVARALASGPVRIGDFTQEAIDDPAVRAVMTRVVAEPMPEERWGADHFPAEVVVTTRDGRRHEWRTERPRGNGPDLALSAAELEDKFHDCCRAAGYAPERTEKLIAEIRGLERADDLTGLVTLLTAEEGQPR